MATENEAMFSVDSFDSVTFTSRDCPCGCGNETELVHLGGQPPREVCAAFGCDWDGRTIEG